MLDVLLVNPPNALDRYDANKDMPPIGMLLIAAVLEQHGYGVAAVDLEFQKQSIDEIIESERPAIVGIAGTSVARFAAFDVARTVKRIDPAILTVYGGVHATFTARDTLDHVPEIDVIARGEGEGTMLDLAAAVKAGSPDLSKIRGITYRADGGIAETPARPRIMDLDALPLPARHLVDMDDYDLRLDLIGKRAGCLITSRGCPINCSFCSASAMFGKTVTYRSAKSVVDEMERQREAFGVSGFKIFDSTFTLSRKHVESICEEILGRDLVCPWECEIRVNNVDPPLLELMRKAGCYLVDFGIESASERILKRMHKGINLKQVEDVLTWTRELGIAQRAFFTVGHIEETAEDAQRTYDFIKRELNNITLLGIGVGVRVYPGTEVERYAFANDLLPGFSWSEPFHEERNGLLRSPPNIPLLAQPQLGYDELLDINRRILSLKARNLRFMARRLFRSHTKEDLKRYAGTLRRLVRSRLA